MKIAKVRLGKRSYNVYIGKNIVKDLSSFIKIDSPETPVFVVTNSKINALHGRKLRKAIKGLSKKALFHNVPDSEKAKSFPVYVGAMAKLANFSKKIKPVVIAFGGGVVGDLGGMLASTYRRGVPLLQIPTTLLAQVDSAIGGKVAIDIKEAKNIVGNFYQPKTVISDLGFLETLPEKQLKNGLAEVIKYGIIRDGRFFSFLEKNIKSILARDPAIAEHIVYKCTAIKANVVEKDEFDTRDVRAILNFGHTIGHAIEAASSYSKVQHGYAVGIGMVMASEIALKLGMLAQKDFERIASLIGKICRLRLPAKARPQNIMNALAYDKKIIRGVNRFVLPVKIGAVKVVDNVPVGLIKGVIKGGIKK